jgi:hypothetical protein
METLVFTADDKRLGTYNADGSMATWPTVDAFGKSYVRVNATVKRLNATQFIVVGPDEEKNIEGFSFERQTAPKSTKTE